MLRAVSLAPDCAPPTCRPLSCSAVAAEREAALPVAGRCAVQWVLGDATALPFGEAEFGAATCGYGLRNVDDIPAALSELHRVLVPGGRAAVLDFNHSDSEAVTAVQGFFLENLVVPLARANGVAPQYEYLRPSIAAFPSGRRLEAMAKASGFETAVHYELAGGLMGILVATKKAG